MGAAIMLRGTLWGGTSLRLCEGRGFWLHDHALRRLRGVPPEPKLDHYPTMRRDVRLMLLTALICTGLSACQSRTPATQAPPNKTAPAIVESPEDKPPPKKVKPPPEPDSPPVAAVRRLL